MACDYQTRRLDLGLPGAMDVRQRQLRPRRVSPPVWLVSRSHNRSRSRRSTADRHPCWTSTLPRRGILVRRGQRLLRQAHGPHLKRGAFRFVIDLQVAIHSGTNLNPKSFVSTTDPKWVLAAVEGGCDRQRVSSLAWPRQTKLPLSKVKVSPPPIAGIRRRPARTFC
jgi:hypothetical protein